MAKKPTNRSSSVEHNSSNSSTTTSVNAKSSKVLERLIDDVSDDEYDVSKETLSQRIAALADILPVYKREQLYSVLSSTGTSIVYGFKFIGSLAWILSTSFIILGLPLLYQIEKEQLQGQDFFEHEKKSQAQKLLQAPPTNASIAAPVAESKQ